MYAVFFLENCVGHAYCSHMFFPGIVMGANHRGQHTQEGSVKLLHKFITLRVIGSCSSLLDVKQPTCFNRYLCFKLVALI